MFRPCIDLHNGVVKQIVGSTLRTDCSGGDGGAASGGAGASGSEPVTNFEAAHPSDHFAAMYKADGLVGGHVVMLGRGNTDAALVALRAFPGGLQVGGGINPDNAQQFLDAGASHVIVTSYVFRDGVVDRERLAAMEAAVGTDRLVLDLSCRRRKTADGGVEFVVVTDKWQVFTGVVITADAVADLASHCAEFLVHGVDVEGKRCGVDEELVRCLAEWSPIPVTYAGGVRDLADVELVAALGRGKVAVTVGSALDIFGGDLPYADVVAWARAFEARTPTK